MPTDRPACARRPQRVVQRAVRCRSGGSCTGSSPHSNAGALAGGLLRWSAPGGTRASVLVLQRFADTDSPRRGAVRRPARSQRPIEKGLQGKVKGARQERCRVGSSRVRAILVRSEVEAPAGGADTVIEGAFEVASKAGRELPCRGGVGRGWRAWRVGVRGGFLGAVFFHRVRARVGFRSVRKVENREILCISSS